MSAANRAAHAAELTAVRREAAESVAAANERLAHMHTTVDRLTTKLSGLSSKVSIHAAQVFENSPYKPLASPKSEALRKAHRANLDRLHASAATMYDITSTSLAPLSSPSRHPSMDAYSQAVEASTRQLGAVLDGALLLGAKKVALLRSDRATIASAAAAATARIDELATAAEATEAQVALVEADAAALAASLNETLAALAAKTAEADAASDELVSLRDSFGNETAAVLVQLDAARAALGNLESQHASAMAGAADKLDAAKATLADSNALMAELDVAVTELTAEVETSHAREAQLADHTAAVEAALTAAEGASETAAAELAVVRNELDEVVATVSAAKAATAAAVASALDALAELDLLTPEATASLADAQKVGIGATVEVLAAVLVNAVNVSQFELGVAADAAEKTVLAAQASVAAARADAAASAKQATSLEDALTKMRSNLNTLVRNAAITQRRKDEEELEDLSAVADALQENLNAVVAESAAIKADLVCKLTEVRGKLETKSTQVAALEVKLSSASSRYAGDKSRLESRLTAALDAADSLQVENRELRIQVSRLGGASQMDLKELRAQNEVLENQAKELAEANAQLGGHSNRKQKIRHLAKVVAENRKLKTDNVRLRATVEKYRLKAAELRSSLSSASLHCRLAE